MLQLATPDYTLGYACLHFGLRFYTWLQLATLGGISWHLATLGCIWSHLVTLGRTLFRLLRLVLILPGVSLDALPLSVDRWRGQASTAGLLQQRRGQASASCLVGCAHLIWLGLHLVTLGYMGLRLVAVGALSGTVLGHTRLQQWRGQASAAGLLQ